MTLAQLLRRPSETLAVLRLGLASTGSKKRSTVQLTPTLQRCYYYLDRTSRSFAAVIHALHPSLRVVVTIFYLVLRALDTIEDDMTIRPLSRKRQLLRDFYKHIDESGWNFCENGLSEPDRDLLVEFDYIVAQFRLLPVDCQAIIKDITMRMGAGMAEYADTAYDMTAVGDVIEYPKSTSDNTMNGTIQNTSENGMDIDMFFNQIKRPTALADARVESVKDYNIYCYYVAGLVGHGLTRLFVASGLESESLLDTLSSTQLANESTNTITSHQSPTFIENDKTSLAYTYPAPPDPALHPGVNLANEMGLFLQKINITRDYQEDLRQGRIFWPQEIWGIYVNRIEELAEPFVTSSSTANNLEARRKSLSCLNHMCADALELVPSVLNYMSRLHEPTVLRFCAIPQVMAIATLLDVFDNPKVFTQVVKIRKGLAAKLILNATSFDAVKSIFRDHARTLRARNNPQTNQQMYTRVDELCQLIELLCVNDPSQQYQQYLQLTFQVVGMILALVVLIIAILKHGSY